MSYITGHRTVILRIKTTKEKVKDYEKAIKGEEYFEDKIRKDSTRDEDMFYFNNTPVMEGYLRVPFEIEYIEKLKQYLKERISDNFELVLVEENGQTEFVLPSGELLGYIGHYPQYVAPVEP